MNGAWMIERVGRSESECSGSLRVNVGKNN